MRAHHERRYKSMLFDSSTTYRVNYRYPVLEAPDLELPKVRTIPKKSEVPYYTTSDETHTHYYEKVPFDLHWGIKPIIRTSPLDKIRPVQSKSEEDHEKTRQSRPHVVLPPAVCIDDVKPAVKKVILDMTYTTTWEKAARESASVDSNMKAPLGAYEKTRPIYLPRLVPPTVPPEWRMETLDWEKRQSRDHLEIDKEFWSQRNLYKDCLACKSTQIVKELRDLKRM